MQQYVYVGCNSYIVIGNLEVVAYINGFCLVSFCRFIQYYAIYIFLFFY